MAICYTCGNDYNKCFEIKTNGKTFLFDCFECAIYTLAPNCNRCGCKIIGHGVEASGSYFCCMHCSKQQTPKNAATQTHVAN